MIKAAMPHMTGLPIADGTYCKIYLHPDKYVFEYKKTTYELPIDRITDVSIKTEKEVQTSYVSSIGGAVGGAVLLGPLGAIIGGRAKKKKTTTRKYYLIISYKKDEKYDCITFDATGCLKAHKFVKEFSKRPVQEKNVML